MKYWKEVIVSFVISVITFGVVNDYLKPNQVKARTVCGDCNLTSNDGGSTSYDDCNGAQCTFSNIECNGTDPNGYCYFYITSAVFALDECNNWVPTAPELWGCVGEEIDCPYGPITRKATMTGLRANLVPGEYEIVWTLLQGGSCAGGGGVKVTSQTQWVVID